MKKKNCFIYTRVSTAMQVDGYSLEAQKEKLRRYAEFQELSVVREYSDEGKSGKSIEGRPEFQEMMNAVATGNENIDYVLVFKLSRFGRNAADVLSSLQLMQDYDVNLICVEDGIDSSKDSGKLMISVLSAVAEIERENILVQTMEGRKQKAREGKWNGGFAPYGYKLVDGELMIGLFISSFGVSFVTKAALGTSPISSIPYVLSLDLPWTLGEFTIVFSVLLIILQIVILGRNFQKVSLLQIPVSILFGYFIDLSMLLLVWLNPQQWVSKFLALFIGCVILAFGVYIEVIANVVMLPGEAFVKAVTVRFHTDFGTTKVCFDASMTVIAGVLSLVLFHALQGVGIGTIIAALIVGFIAKFFGRILTPFTELLFGKVEEKIITDEPEETPLVITIAREYGSGGRDIGKALAKRLSIEYYDTKVLKIAARESGKTQAYIDKNDQKVTGSLIFDLYLESTAYTAGVAENGKSAFGAEEQVIKELAAKKSCVIVGRLANFTLQNHKNAFHIFVHGDMKDKVRRVMERDGLSRTEAEKKIKTMDRERGEHCRLVTGKEWGQARYYDLSVNTSKYNTEQIVDFILNFCK